MTRSGTIQKRANRVNGLTVAADDSADVGLAQLHLKNCHFPAGDFGKHHVVGKFDQLPDDELEKFFHGKSLTTNEHESTRISWDYSFRYVVLKFSVSSPTGPTSFPSGFNSQYQS